MHTAAAPLLPSRAAPARVSPDISGLRAAPWNRRFPPLAPRRCRPPAHPPALLPPRSRRGSVSSVSGGPTAVPQPCACPAASSGQQLCAAPHRPLQHLPSQPLGTALHDARPPPGLLSPTVPSCPLAADFVLFTPGFPCPCRLHISSLSSGRASNGLRLRGLRWVRLPATSCRAERGSVGTAGATRSAGARCREGSGAGIEGDPPGWGSQFQNCSKRVLSRHAVSRARKTWISLCSQMSA